MLWHCWLGDVYRIWHVKTRCSIRQKVSFADRPDMQFLENNPVIQEPKVVVMNYEVVMILIWHILSPLLEWCGLLQDDVLFVRTCFSRAEACIMLIQCVNEIWLILDPNTGLQVCYFWAHKRKGQYTWYSASFIVNHHRRSAQVWHMFSRDFTVLYAHPHDHL